MSFGKSFDNIQHEFHLNNYFLSDFENHLVWKEERLQWERIREMNGAPHYKAFKSSERIRDTTSLKWLNNSRIVPFPV